MMNLVEKAILYATVMHQGRMRKLKTIPFILHPLEVAQILATVTDDQEIIAAGILHDIVEDADGTLEEIRNRFGNRVALLVEAETEPEFPEETSEETWQRRKEQALLNLRHSEDIGVKMLWLADSLANIRSLARGYSENGENVWSSFHQKDPARQCWYYRTVAEYVELDLNRTGAYKELIKHINYLWPGTFDSEKARYRKYKEVSIDGCRLLGSGKKGDVYRYDEELIIKVYNRNNTYRDVEREIEQSRRAFVLGIPTAISFGIVSVGDRYGAMYELMDSETLTTYLATNPSKIDYYASVMANLARTIHGTQAGENDCFPDARDRFRAYIAHGIKRIDSEFADRCMHLIYEIPQTRYLMHGDLHTSNVFLQNTEALLIDLDRLTVGAPILELGDMYLYYAASGNRDPDSTDPYLGIPYATCRRFFDLFLKHYLQTEDETRLRNVKDQAALLGYLRLINRYWKNGAPAEKDRRDLDGLVRETKELLERVDSLNSICG